jgi:poly(3-hydroxybutyrate) depolymerase
MARKLTALVTSGLIGLASFAAGSCFSQEAPSASAPKTLRERWAERRAGDQGKPAVANVQITGPGDYSLSLVHAGQTRLYRVHVPASYSAAKPAPLVFSLHGGSGNMDYQANDSYYGQISKSDQTGFVAVFPNGFSKLKSGKLATWNAGNCCAGARDEDSDDVGFIRDIIKSLSAQLNVDPRRIFANGISNGGMMAYRLACEMPDVFRAIASVAGTDNTKSCTPKAHLGAAHSREGRRTRTLRRRLRPQVVEHGLRLGARLDREMGATVFRAIASVAGTDNTKSCTPKAPISVLHIHAKDDELELFDGGSGRKSSKVTAFVSVPDSIAKWVRLNSCSTTPKRVFENAGAYCDAYTQCRGGVEVKLCVTPTGGHSWPGGKKPRGDTPGSTALSATDVIADFFVSR